jgi:synaptosomal-associated protein 25
MPKPPPEPVEEEPKPMSELELLQFKGRTVANDSLESTRRMMNLCEEAKDSGIKTLVALDDQGEQLDNIEKGLTTINEEMREAEKQLAGLEKSLFWYVFCECCGTCELPCFKKTNKEDEKVWNKNEDSKPGGQGPPRQSGAQVLGYGGYIAKITNDAQEEEMAENMEQVSAMVGNLRNMAVDMNGEVENQNRQLDRIQGKTESNLVRLKGANERAGKLLK